MGTLRCVKLDHCCLWSYPMRCSSAGSIVMIDILHLFVEKIQKQEVARRSEPSSTNTKLVCVCATTYIHRVFASYFKYRNRLIAVFPAIRGVCSSVANDNFPTFSLPSLRTGGCPLQLRPSTHPFSRPIESTFATFTHCNHPLLLSLPIFSPKKGHASFPLLTAYGDKHDPLHPNTWLELRPRSCRACGVVSNKRTLWSSNPIGLPESL